MQKDIVRLYVGDGLTLREIGDKIGVSRQTVCNILQDAGVRAAQKAKKRRTEHDVEIRRLYVDEDRPIRKIAQIVNLSVETVSDSLRAQNISIKRGGQRSIVFPELRELKIGDSLDLPQVAGTKRNKYTRYYTMAKKAGIRVSVRVISDEKVSVRRVA